MLAIATESIVKLAAFLAVGAVRDVSGCSTARSSCSRSAMSRPDTAAVLTRPPKFSTLFAMTVLSFFAIVLLPRQFHVTVVENHRESEDPPRGLAVSALSRPDQPVRDSDRARRPADLPGRARWTATCSCWRCRCRPGFELLHHRRLCRRPVGRDRHGDRGDRSRLPSWCRTTWWCRSCCSGVRAC